MDDLGMEKTLEKWMSDVPNCSNTTCQEVFVQHQRWIKHGIFGESNDSWDFVFVNSNKMNGINGIHGGLMVISDLMEALPKKHLEQIHLQWYLLHFFSG